MVDFPALRTAAKPLREAVAAAEADLVSFGAETARLERAGELYDTERVQRVDQRKALVGARTAARIALHELLAGELDEADPKELPPALDPEVPLVLLPVRLETRLKPDGPNPTTLLVRIFPDDVHLESHEPELTDGERQLGQRYWTTVWRAGKNENDLGDRARILTAAWEELRGVLGPARARWVARRLTPPVDDRPEAPNKNAPAPTLAEVPERGQGWTRPATASTLPDQFVARAFQRDESGNEILVGQNTGLTVHDSVQVGPDPEYAPEPGEGKPLDPALAWLVDFEAAKAIGLAIEVELGGEQHPAYITSRTPLLSRVVVVGVSASLTAEASSERLDQLLVGQQHTRGVAFLAQDTPTNNTAAGGGTWAAQPDVDEMLLNADDLPPDFERANANVVARALGLSPARLAKVPGADELEQADARALQLALWPATGDFFLDQLLEEDTRQKKALDFPQREELRRHFTDHVRARGPLPVLRVGKQPYGLLPASSFADWQPGGEGERAILAGVHARLADLRPFWEAGLPYVPRVGAWDESLEDPLDVPRPERDLVRSLSVAPVSRAVYARGVRGAANACFTNVLTGVAEPCGDTPEARFAQVVNAALGLGYTPVITHHQNEAGQPPRLWLPLVRPLGLADAAAVAELSNFLEAAINEYEGVLLVVEEQQARTLLEAMLRHVANLEYARAAARRGAFEGVFATPELFSTEVIVAHTEPAAVSAFQLDAAVTIKALTAGAVLSAPIPQAEGLSALAVIKADHASFGGDIRAAADSDGWMADLLTRERPWSTRLTEIDAALQYLARRVGELGTESFPVLERLLGESLDLVSHRLDAWITSLATQRLAGMRGQKATGVQLGAYGWVEDLHYREEKGRSDGSILAPSLPQATTAAILRSGALSHPTGDEVFAVDLSSRRMRVAMAILDGVRAGQPIGALLGYRLERRLHEAREGPNGLELDWTIAPLREIAPQRAVHHEGSQAQEFIAAHDVVDGAALVEREDSGTITQLRGKMTRNWKAGEQEAIADALSELRRDVDAVADLLLAESVHQLANGNPDRAGATLATLAAGGQPPPRPQILETPRPGTPVTHRLLVVVPKNAPRAAGWDTPKRRGRPRAQAEPRLDAWAGHLLGPPDRFRFRIEWKVGDQTVATTEHPLSLEDECPLDVLALAAGNALAAAALSRVSERPQGVPAEAVPSVAGGRDPAWDRSVVSLDELSAIARAAAAALSTALPAAPADFGPAHTPASAGDGQDLLDRAKGAKDGLKSAKEYAEAKLAAPTETALQEALAKLGEFGLGPPVPSDSLVGDTLEEQLKAAVKAAESRLAAVPADPLDASHSALVLEAVFGSGFTAADLIALPNADALTASLGPGLERGDPDLDPVRTWLERAAAVRPAAGRLADALLYSEAAGVSSDWTLKAGQTPFAEGDRWVGADGHPKEVPATGLVLHCPADGPDLSDPVAAVVIDMWTELIPTRRQTAGVALHFDAPGARPPHAILLAVPPARGAQWTLETLTGTVRDTLDLAKLRLVDLETLAWLGRYLPAAYISDGLLGKVPGIDLKGMYKAFEHSGHLADFMRAET